MRIVKLILLLTLFSVIVQKTPVWATAEQTPDLKLVDKFGGEIRAVAVQGNFAYVGEGAMLTILNIANRTQPIVVGQGPTLTGEIMDIQVVDNIVYALNTDWLNGIPDTAGVTMIDVSNPTAPRLLGTYTLKGRGNFQAIFVHNNTLYIADGHNGLLIVDVKQPATPTLIGSYTEYIGVDVEVVGDLAYLASGRTGLQIVDVSNPSAPFRISPFKEQYVDKVTVVNNIAHTIDGVKKTWNRIDVSDPMNPKQVATTELYTHIDKIAIVDNVAFVTQHYSDYDTTGEIQAYQFDGSTTNRVAKQFTFRGDADHLAIAGNTAFVPSDSGLLLVDLSNVFAKVDQAPSLLARYASTPTRGLYAEDNYLFAFDQATVFYDLSKSRTRPTSVFGIDSFTSIENNQVTDIAVENNIAYVGYGNNGFRAILRFDISNPNRIKQIGSTFSDDVTGPVPYFDFNLEFDVVGNHFYVVTGSELQIYDISDPQSYAPLGTTKLQGLGLDIQVVGTIAYVLDKRGFAAIDVSNPNAPRTLSTPSVTGNVEDMVATQDTVYVLTDKGLSSFAVENLDAVRWVSAYVVDNAKGVHIAHGTAYVSHREQLLMIDVSDRKALTLQNRMPLSQTIWADDASVTTIGNNVYIANLYGGVFVYERTDLAGSPTTPQNDSGDCVIPAIGPWPPCATGGANTGGDAGSSVDCVIPVAGPWPPCATGGTTPPDSGQADCVIPESGPWPACATGG